jgi:hypothetical protein
MATATQAPALLHREDAPAFATQARVVMHPEDAPVFVTADGRPRRAVAWVGRLAALLLALWIAGVLLGAMGFTRLPMLRPTLAVHAAGTALRHSARQLPTGVVRPVVRIRKARGDVEARGV